MAVVLLAACGKTFLYGVQSAAAVQSVYVQTFFSSLLPGTQSLFRLYAVLTDGSTRALEAPPTGWRSSDGSVAAVDVAGNVRFVRAGTAVVTGTDAESGLSADAPVSILSAGFTSLSVSCPSFTLPRGFAQDCRAELVFNNQATAEASEVVFWAVANGSGQATVSNATGQRGRVTGVAPGVVTVTAAIGGLSSQVTVQISNESLSAVALSPADATIGVGGAIAYSARAVFSSGTQLDVTRLGRWTSGNSAVLAIDASTGSGVAGIAGAIVVGFAIGGVGASTSLNVVAPALSIEFSPAELALVSGQQVGFRVLARYPGNVTSDVTYSAVLQTDDPTVAIATVGTSDPPGVVAALAPGHATINASFAGLRAALPVTVTTLSLVGIAIDPPMASAPVGHAVEFHATASYSDGSSNDVTQLCLWTHSDPSVSVSNSIPKGIAIGSVGSVASQIACRYGGLEGSATLSVTAVNLVSIAITPGNPTIGIGAALQFVATGHYSDGSTRNITDQVSWSSTDGAVAPIDSRGQATGSGAGATMISAGIGPIYDSTNLTVSALVQTGSHRIFVTSSTFDLTQVTSVAAADAICVTIASNGMLGGIWRAILSSSSIPAAQHIQITGEVYNLAPTPQLVATYNAGATSLWSGSLVNAPDYDETGSPVSAAVWTGTMSNGGAGTNCNDWSTSSGAAVSVVGSPSSTGGSWLAVNGMSCNSSARIYCIDGQ